MNRLAALVGVLALLSGCASEAFDSPDDPGGKADVPPEPEQIRDPVAAVSDWNASLSDDDRHAKFCKMAESAFVFYRGTNHLYWDDLGQDERLGEFGTNKTRTWIQGDLHAENFGTFDNDDGELVYSLNDFDESVVADYQLDLWRMAASLVLVAEQNGNLTEQQQVAVIDEFVEEYLDTMESYRGNDDETKLVLAASVFSQRLVDLLAEVAEDESRTKMLDKWTVVGEDGVRRLNTDKSKLGELSESDAQAILDAMEGYGHTLSGGLDYDPDYFFVKSAASRLLAGTGSLGTPRYYVLIEGETADNDDDRILDVKLQGTPTAIVFASAAARAEYEASFDNDAERHAAAYKALIKDTDDHLGWMELSDGFYSVRERSFAKESVPLDEIDTEAAYLELAADWGMILATTHARADKDFDAALVPHSVDKQISEATGGSHKKVRALVREVAFEYAAVVGTDFQLFTEALAPTDCDE